MRGVKVSILAQEYNIGNSTIYDIKKQSKELKAYASVGETMKGCNKWRTQETSLGNPGWSSLWLVQRQTYWG